MRANEIAEQMGRNTLDLMAQLIIRRQTAKVAHACNPGSLEEGAGGPGAHSPQLCGKFKFYLHCLRNKSELRGSKKLEKPSDLTVQH